MIQTFDCEQGSPEWIAARLGIPTASEFHSILAKGQGKTRRTYMYKLAGERLTGEPMESYSNGHMERGKDMEDEARSLYVFQTDAELTNVGFIRNGDKGCSPDSLIGANGMLEIKTKLPHLQLDVLESDAVPGEHIAQCQGALWVAEREWIDFESYWPKLRPFIKRVYRNERYIATLKVAVDEFNEELNNLVERFR